MHWRIVENVLHTMLEENLFYSTLQQLSEVLRESPVNYKALLTGSYTVLLTVGKHEDNR